MTPSEPPSVCIVVPTLNEQDYIAGCLASLARQWPDDRCEILVADGGSTDATRTRVAQVQTLFPAVRLIENPRRLQSAAVNMAAREAAPHATILIRADAHAIYPPGFVQACVSALAASGATSVVVPMRNAARPGMRMQRAIAAAQSSPFGNGGASHRTGAASGFVDHGHHAAFDRGVFLSIGGYDETFSHNEDAEFDVRAVAAGGAVWMCAEAPVTYFPRTTLPALAAQYMRHGRGRARTLLKHRIRPKPRQMAPLALLLTCLAAAGAAPLWPTLAAGALIYPLACLSWAACQAVRRRDPWLTAAGPALIVMHMGWAIGFLHQVARPGAAPPSRGRACFNQSPMPVIRHAQPPRSGSRANP